MPRLVAGDSRLEGTQLRQFHVGVVDAFTDVQDLTSVLRFGLDKRLNLITSPNKDLDEIVFDVIDDADTKGWSAELLQVLRTSRPTNQKLLVFAQQFALAPPSPGNSQLELLITQGDEFIDVVKWRTRLAQCEAAICRVERDQIPIGTGFLLGPSVVMTNYHVVEGVIDESTDPARIGLRFDYKILEDGLVVNPGKVYRLAPDWDLHHSPYSAADTEADPGDIPGMDELDHVLLQVDGAPGDEGATGPHGVDPKAPPRGFLRLPPGPHDWTNKGLMILQHPDGQPLKLAIRSDGVIGTLPLNGSPTRVRYATRTEPGSSGSPCFDLAWNLIALHHSGDPKYSKLNVNPEWNEGVPLGAILASLDQAGVRSKLG
jgi:hypothetical protein